METNPNQFLKDTEDTTNKLILSVSAIAFDFDFVTSDPSKSRADEIRVLLIKNNKPTRKSKEGKPGGIGLPTGQLESKEAMLDALKRETRNESGYPVKTVVGKLFVVSKPHVNNEIHVFLVETQDNQEGVRERDEIDVGFEPWVSLRAAFQLPLAQNRDGNGRNPDGMYFSHRQRLFRAIESMILFPEKLIDGGVIEAWLVPKHEVLNKAMTDLENAGLLKDFIPQHDDSKIVA